MLMDLQSKFIYIWSRCLSLALPSIYLFSLQTNLVYNKDTTIIILAFQPSKTLNYFQT